MKKKTTTTIKKKGNKTITKIIEETLTPMYNEKTQLVCVLDRSGSMREGGFINEAIDRFNEYIAEQKTVSGEATITVVLFDDKYEVLYDNIDLQSIKPMKKDVWLPRGMTALYDAIGKTINVLNETHSKLKPEEVPAKVLFIILTDGYENASREFNSLSVKKLIGEKEKKNWNFIFLGANQNAFGAASQMGISYGNTMSFANTAQGSSMYNTAIGSASTKYRSMSTLDGGFQKMSKSMIVDEPDDKDKQDELNTGIATSGSMSVSNNIGDATITYHTKDEC